MALRAFLQAHIITDDLKRTIEDQLYKTFKPEFLNRLDAIVFFKRLEEQDVQQIARIQINDLAERLKASAITLSVDDAVTKEIARRGWRPELGARPLKRAIQQDIVIPLSQYILRNPESKNIHLFLKNNTISID